MDIHLNNKESILLDNDDIILHETKEDNKCCIIF